MTLDKGSAPCRADHMML